MAGMFMSLPDGIVIPGIEVSSFGAGVGMPDMAFVPGTGGMTIPGIDDISCPEGIAIPAVAALSCAGFEDLLAPTILLRACEDFTVALRGFAATLFEAEFLEARLFAEGFFVAGILIPGMLIPGMFIFI
ncbi:MAG: hypothetical protein NVS3B5_06630 [Sphingomicrobium sp.]